MSNAGPIRYDMFREQLGEFVSALHKFKFGFLAQLRPSHDVNDWQANQSNEEWNDLTIKVYGSDANDLISDGGWDNF